jgi:hypothetical protein
LQLLLGYNLERSLHTSGRATRIADNSFSIGHVIFRELRVQEDHDATDKDREYKSSGRKRRVSGKGEAVRTARGLDVPLETCYFFSRLERKGSLTNSQ